MANTSEYREDCCIIRVVCCVSFDVLEAMYLRAFIIGWFFGDPHIRTLDGLRYTVNGLGEYVLIVTTEGNFTLQGRTTRALDNQGNQMQGTVFSAFAASDADSDRVHVQMNDTRNGKSELRILWNWFNDHEIRSTQSPTVNNWDILLSFIIKCIHHQSGKYCF